jgi:hypothetical protein
MLAPDSYIGATGYPKYPVRKRNNSGADTSAKIALICERSILIISSSIRSFSFNASLFGLFLPG